MAAAIQIGCRSRAIAVTAVTTPPLPLRASNEPSACRENVTGPLFEAIIRGRVPRSVSNTVEDGISRFVSADARSGMVPPSAWARGWADSLAAPGPPAILNYASSAPGALSLLEASKLYRPPQFEVCRSLIGTILPRSVNGGRRWLVAESDRREPAARICPWCGSADVRFVQRGYAGPTDEVEQYMA